MNCSKIMDMVYNDNDISFLTQIQIDFHTFFCSSCAREIERYQDARSIMKNGFFPSSPELSDSWANIENSIMAKVDMEEETETQYPVPGVLSTRGWVISGLIIMISLVTVFFAFDFKYLASESGMSFLLPIGITIGIVLTTYGALFIGSHLKELSERFGL
ncbi:MAG: peptidoglycan-binding protein [Treponema sp.]|nr:peptidoglycan-binding protein [Treponema sp.]